MKIIIFKFKIKSLFYYDIEKNTVFSEVDVEDGEEGDKRVTGVLYHMSTTGGWQK